MARAPDTQRRAVIISKMKMALQKTSTLDVQIGTQFEDQFIAPYLSRIFPWALNYETGGPEYPDFFSMDNDEEASLRSRYGSNGRYRRKEYAGILTPARHAKNIARRIEAQIAGDWTLVSSAHNLTMRWNALRHSYLTCKMQLPTDRALSANAALLVDAADMLFKRLHCGTYTTQGQKRPINGDITKLQYADGLSGEEKILVGCFGKVTKKVAGSQSLRPRIGHSMFGYRVNHGEGQFFTISPSTRHSSLIHRLQRNRRCDSVSRGTQNM